MIDASVLRLADVIEDDTARNAEVEYYFVSVESFNRIENTKTDNGRRLVSRQY